MTDTTDTFTDYDPSALPPVVVAYLDARDEGRHADAVAAFATDATVIDDGGTHEGVDEIDAWVGQSSSAFTYTSTRIGQQVLDAAHVTVRVRIDGDFPGGTATLRQRFELADGLVTRLTIEV